MLGEIRQAMDLLEGRKQAANGGELKKARITTLEHMLAVWSGLDLDPGEIGEMAPLVDRTVRAALLSGAPLGPLATSMFWEGLAAGLIVAELREKEESADA